MDVRIAVTGSRDREPTPAEVEDFERYFRNWDGSVLLHGACPVPGPPTDLVTKMRGVDRWADEWAIRNGIPVERFPPLQKSIGWPRCGPERNRRMIAAAEVLIAFPGERGTENTITAATRRHLPVHRVGTLDAWRAMGYQARVYVDGIEQRLF